jgi:DNA-binding beta-propeller fold protein YncE
MKRIQYILFSLVFSCSLLGCEQKMAFAAEDGKPKKEKKNKTMEPASKAVQIVQKWEVPPILQEVSGIVYLGNGQFACVQDEAGVIFVYDTNTKKIERQITFGAAGDYEGLALVGTTAYVVRSDGRLFEVTNIHSAQNKITEFATPLTPEHNVEGLTHDPKHNRLLLAIKGEEANGADFKGVYAFDLATKKLAGQPVFKLNLNDQLLSKQKAKTLAKSWQPSEIAVHPVSGQIYLTEASNPQLFILNPDGSIKNRFKLSDAAFYKPEGIAFSPQGDLYISNEGKKQPANILRVNVQELE